MSERQLDRFINTAIEQVLQEVDPEVKKIAIESDPAELSRLERKPSGYQYGVAEFVRRHLTKSTSEIVKLVKFGILSHEIRPIKCMTTFYLKRYVNNVKRLHKKRLLKRKLNGENM